VALIKWGIMLHTLPAVIPAQAGIQGFFQITSVYPPLGSQGQTCGYDDLDTDAVGLVMTDPMARTTLLNVP